MVRVRCAIVAALTLLSSVSQSSAQCPSYTKKTAIAGTPSSLPQGGWCVYTKKNTNGLFRSSIMSFSESAISGTSNDRPGAIDISPDGEWIVYLNTTDKQIYLVKSSGGNRTLVPVQHFNSPFLDFVNVGFRRNAPGGTLEIFFDDFSWPGNSYMGAIPVTLGTVASFGTAKIIADTKPIGIWIYSGAHAVWGDQIFGIFFNTSTNQHINMFLTIPESGRGIATSEDFFTYSNPISQDYWGCGETMSHDGQYCASNSRFIGTADCTPNQKSNPPMDHKGFYITRFLRKGGVASTIDGQIDNATYGVSNNWCPENYRQGDNTNVDFNNWNFSNHNEYVIGRVLGDRITTYALSYGLWIVHWPTNTWTQITPATTTVQYDEPALFIPGGSAVENNRQSRNYPHAGQQTRLLVGGRIVLDETAKNVNVYGIDGRSAYSFTNRSVGNTRSVTLPANSRASAWVIEQK